jgi:hypothetical protein
MAGGPAYMASAGDNLIARQVIDDIVARLQRCQAGKPFFGEFKALDCFNPKGRSIGKFEENVIGKLHN